MKTITLLGLLMLFVSCGVAKKTYNMHAELNSACPAAGTCTVEIIHDKSLNVINDDFGRPYYTIADGEGRVVVKYTYTKTRNPDYADDSYEEQVVFETNAGFTDLNKTEKILFGVHCFCRGKAGFYTVKDAVLTYKNNILEVSMPDIVQGQLTHLVTVALE